MPTTFKIDCPTLLLYLSKVSNVEALLKRQGATEIVVSGNDILSTTQCKTDKGMKLCFVSFFSHLTFHRQQNYGPDFGLSYENGSHRQCSYGTKFKACWRSKDYS